MESEKEELISEYLYYKKLILEPCTLDVLKTYDTKIREIRADFKDKFGETIEETIQNSNNRDFII